MHFSYTRPDGGVSVVHLAPKARLDGETDDAFIARHKAEMVERAQARAADAEAEGLPGPAAAARAEADAIATTATDKPALPSRAYRDAWTLSGGRVQHDMAKARAAKLAEIREERNKRLAATDGTYLRAQEAGDTATLDRLKTMRQRLRDLPATVALDNIPDADTLKAFEPNWPA